MRWSDLTLEDDARRFLFGHKLLENGYILLNQKGALDNILATPNIAGSTDVSISGIVKVVVVENIR